MAGFPRVLEQEGDVLTLDPTRLLIAFSVRPTDHGAPRRVASRPDIEAALARLHLGFEDDPWALRDPEGGSRLNHTHSRLWVRDTQGAAIDAARLDVIRQGLAQIAEWVGPVYAGGTGRLSARICPLPAVLLVAFRPGLSAADTASAIAALAAFGLHERPERSAYLGSFRYFVPNDVARQNVYELRAEILKKLGAAVRRVRYEQMPFESPLAFTPNDEYFPEQWNLVRIEAPRAWDITQGRADIVIAVIDSGCDLGHADLSFAAPGVNLDDMSRSGSPVLTPDGFLVGHGTQVAGIAAAITDNAIGVAGIAGRCRILPLATDSYTDAHVAAGIRYAVEHGARVVNMSFNTMYFTLFDGPVAEAIEFAHGRRVFLCASAGNGDSRGILAPARHPLVAAVGGSDVRDERWSVPWPDGGRRGSNYGDERVEGVWTGVSVVAPAWNVFPTTGMPTTDITGTEGDVNLPSPAGDYWHIGGFSMTSCASPHVAGVAALLAAQYDLEPDAITRIIERTADKVGSIPYAVVEGFPHGARNEEMGYGRLNAFHAVDFADVMIRDWSGDEGIEPSSAPRGEFWIASDIVVRPRDDGLFVPGSPDESSLLTGGVINYIYYKSSTKARSRLAPCTSPSVPSCRPSTSPTPAIGVRRTRRISGPPPCAPISRRWKPAANPVGRSSRCPWRRSMSLSVGRSKGSIRVSWPRSRARTTTRSDRPTATTPSSHDATTSRSEISASCARRCPITPTSTCSGRASPRTTHSRSISASTRERLPWTAASSCVSRIRTSRRSPVRRHRPDRAKAWDDCGCSIRFASKPTGAGVARWSRSSAAPRWRSACPAFRWCACSRAASSPIAGAYASRVPRPRCSWRASPENDAG